LHSEALLFNTLTEKIIRQKKTQEGRIEGRKEIGKKNKKKREPGRKREINQILGEDLKPCHQISRLEQYHTIQTNLSNENTFRCQQQRAELSHHKKNQLNHS